MSYRVQSINIFKENIDVQLSKNKNVTSFKRKANVAADSEKILKRPAFSDIKNNIYLKTESQIIGKEKSVIEFSKNSVQQLVTIDDKNQDCKKYNNLDKRINYRPAPKKNFPPGVVYDFDLENWEDVHGVPEYAPEIFEYLKSREAKFKVNDYIEQQKQVTPLHRSILVDWMVSVQLNFEFDHETLYRAVKLVDLYLMKFEVSKNSLQLLGMASMLIANKFNEVRPATVGDFIYISENAYTSRELIAMEAKIFKAMKFDIGIPDSYTFLRRYGECAKVELPVLLLARYILEYSLMNHVIATFSDSKVAAASLYLAMQMHDAKTLTWTRTIEYHSGYKTSDFKYMIYVLNDNLRKPYKNCKAIFAKYSSRNFLKVSLKPMIKNYEIQF